MTDPWLIQNASNVNETHSNEVCNTIEIENSQESLEFEDNFTAPAGRQTTSTQEHRPLPDSAAYLQGLERKLQKLKKGSKLLDALSEKRNGCLRTLLQEENSTLGANNENLLELEAPLNNVDSAVQEIYRHLQPVQAVTIGETVHIVHYDQLAEQKAAEEINEDDEESPPASL